jgi:2-desacetyl-2-hydroxyethyl bacteriochlorophyllide A dehydrogenase
MKTLILDQPGHFQLTETQPPTKPNPGEALVRVRRVGICGTDLHAFRGEQPFFSYPRILGHELGVEVVALDPGDQESTIQVGDLCAVEPYLNCGQCSACRRGRTNCCQSLQVLGVYIDGGMREWITAPLRKLHKAPTVPVEHLAVVEMLCIGAHAVRRAQVTPGEVVLVVGAGPIGLAVMQFALLAGAQVIGMELSDKRIEFCTRHLGVQSWVEPRSEPAPQLRKLLGGELPLTVFDATGSPKSMAKTFHYVEQGGKLVFVSIVQADIPLPDPEFHRRESTLLSSRNATRADFVEVIDQLSAGAIQLTPWITHRATPEELVEAFPDWLNPDYGVVKAMLTF